MEPKINKLQSQSYQQYAKSVGVAKEDRPTASDKDNHVVS